MTPAAILAKALSSRDSFALGKLARELDIPAPQVRRAANGAHGQPTRAAYHLKLCFWLGVEPFTGEAMPPRLIEFDAVQFALATKMSRFAHGHTVREAAAAMEMSATVLTRIQFGEDCSLENIMAACRYGDLKLTNYLRPSISHETTTRNAA